MWLENLLCSTAVQLLYIDSRPAAVWQHDSGEAAAVGATCSRHAAENSAEPHHANCSRTVSMSQEVRSTDTTHCACVRGVEGAGRMECNGCSSRQQSPVPEGSSPLYLCALFLMDLAMHSRANLVVTHTAIGRFEESLATVGYYFPQLAHYSFEYVCSRVRDTPHCGVVIRRQFAAVGSLLCERH